VLPWLTPFCISVGIFALALFAYLAAVYATLETEDPELQNDFRIRAIAAGVAVGLMAAVVLLLSINGAPRIWRGLTGRPWTWPLIWATSALGIIALHSLWTRRYQLARFCAPGEVTLILWGWAFAHLQRVRATDNATADGARARRRIGAPAAVLLVSAGCVQGPRPKTIRVFVPADESPERARPRGSGTGQSTSVTGLRT
jgi:cytochrome d ubiquinol oxidase subunit II